MHVCVKGGGGRGVETGVCVYVCVGAHLVCMCQGDVWGAEPAWGDQAQANDGVD